MADELVTLETLAGTLPDPTEFRRRALDAARAGYAALAEGQEVHTPEDTFEVQRQLTRTIELAKAYSATFTAVAKELAGFQRDQLELLPGGPTAVKIPDAEGDITVQLDTANSYSFDEGQLLLAVAAHVCNSDAVDAIIWACENATDTDAQHVAIGERMAVLLVAGVETVAAMGQLGLQVTKVRAFADQLARDGELGLSGVVRDAIIKATKVKGAKYTRKEAK
jgi:hypothetical protein